MAVFIIVAKLKHIIVLNDNLNYCISPFAIFVDSLLQENVCNIVLFDDLGHGALSHNSPDVLFT